MSKASLTGGTLQLPAALEEVDMVIADPASCTDLDLRLRTLEVSILARGNVAFRCYNCPAGAAVAMKADGTDTCLKIR